jgi:hypothetical protein
LLTGSVATLGAVGVGLGSALTGVAYAEGPVTLGRVSKKMKLKGRNWRYRKGESGRGDCYGELLDEHGEKVGNFYSTNLGMKAPFEDDAMSSGMEFQIFSLASGTIFGMGLGAHEEETDGAYSIIGGTGSYSNHGGSYVGKQHSLEFGGDGSAEFSFSLSR